MDGNHRSFRGICFARIELEDALAEPYILGVWPFCHSRRHLKGVPIMPVSVRPAFLSDGVGILININREIAAGLRTERPAAA